jgi:polar amino acid transport system permease protein
MRAQQLPGPLVLSYHLNFNFVWKYFDHLSWGLVLSVELAAASILIGILIGLSLALLARSGGRIVRSIIAAYVEFVRNVPLLLLVYLVFYGVPSVGGFAYDATTSFIVTLAVYAGAYLVEVFRAGLDAIPKGLIEAGKAIGLTPASASYPLRCPPCSASYCLPSATPSSLCSRIRRLPP